VAAAAPSRVHGATGAEDRASIAEQSANAPAAGRVAFHHRHL